MSAAAYYRCETEGCSRGDCSNCLAIAALRETVRALAEAQTVASAEHAQSTARLRTTLERAVGVAQQDHRRHDLAVHEDIGRLGALVRAALSEIAWLDAQRSA